MTVEECGSACIEADYATAEAVLRAIGGITGISGK
jgi:hypothetical protein